MEDSRLQSRRSQMESCRRKGTLPPPSTVSDTNTFAPSKLTKIVLIQCMEKGLKNLLSAGRNAQRRSKSDPSAGDKDSDHDDPHDDSGIGGMEADPPDENGHSGSRPPMQSKGHHHPPSPPPPPPSHHHHHNSSGADYKISTNKSSNCTYHPVPSTSSMPQSATASSQPSFRPSLVMPSIASILQPVSLHSF